MSRRSEPTPFEYFFSELTELSIMLPLWATIPAAILLYYFVPAIELSQSLFQDQSGVLLMIFKVFYIALFKYIVPAALLTGALISVLQRIRSRVLFGSISQQGALKAIQSMSWQDFEFLMFEWFKKQGYSAQLTGGGGADGGIDIKLHDSKGLHLVQCKHYKASKVPVTVIREVYGLMTAEKAVGGFVVTSGKFTKEALAFAQKNNINLIDGRKLVSILDDKDLPKQKLVTVTEITCPKCGSKLVEKSGKYGKFLGCITYPKCNYSKSL
ncbi:MAG: restriction endonuclease [Candidatus Paceibacteria bacterium]